MNRKGGVFVSSCKDVCAVLDLPPMGLLVELN